MQIHSSSSQGKIFLTEPEVRFVNSKFNDVTEIAKLAPKEMDSAQMMATKNHRKMKKK